MSIAEMEQDKRIMEVNSDIVSMVKEVALIPHIMKYCINNCIV